MESDRLARVERLWNELTAMVRTPSAMRLVEELNREYDEATGDAYGRGWMEHEDAVRASVGPGFFETARRFLALPHPAVAVLDDAKAAELRDELETSLVSGQTWIH